MDALENSEDSNNRDVQSTGPIESPFKLIKVKGTVPSFGLNVGPRATSPTLKNPGCETSPISPTSPTIPPLNPISLNPFSLSKLKKTTPVNGTTIPRLSPLSGMGKEQPLEQKIAELQNEVACLKKEIESKDAKLSSSMRSIKMFWSPELKKERAAHKDDVERMLIMKSQCDSLQAEVKRLKSGDGFSDIRPEHEFTNASQKCEPTTVEHKDELNAINETLKQELEVMGRKYNDLQLNFALKHEQYLEKEAELNALNHIVEKLKHEENEKASIQNGMVLVEGELSKVKNELKSKEIEIESLYKEISNVQKENDSSSYALKMKESANKGLQLQMNQVKEENDSLTNSFQEAEKRCITLEDELQQKNSDVDRLEMMKNNLKSELESSVDECKSLQTTLEDTRGKILDLVEDLEKTKRHAASKEEELNELRDEVLKMKLVIEENEKLIEDNREAVSKMEVSRRRESVEMKDLQSVVECKSKEVESLNKKYETLDTYLSHRETALSHARDELNEIKSKHASCTTTISFMENQIADKDQLIARLEKQRNRLEKEKEEEVQSAVRNKDDNEAKSSSLTTLVEEKEVIIKELEEKMEKIQTDLDESKSEILSFSNVLKEKESTIVTLNSDLVTAKQCVENLEKTLNERKNNEENDRNSLRVMDDSQKRFSGSTPVKDSKMIKQLWDEIAKKDSKLQDLEK